MELSTKLIGKFHKMEPSASYSSFHILWIIIFPVHLSSINNVFLLSQICDAKTVIQYIALSNQSELSEKYGSPNKSLKLALIYSILIWF